MLYNVPYQLCNFTNHLSAKRGRRNQRTWKFSRFSRPGPRPITLNTMIKNYFKIAWRNLLRNRAFSAINITGLSIGLASCMLISLYVLDELSFDRFNENADRIVRVVFKGDMNGSKINEAHVMPPTASTLQADYPEVMEATRLRQAGEQKVIVNTKQYNGDVMFFADPNIFQVFTLPLIQGDAKTALAQPYQVVLSEATAVKYFGKTDVLGSIIKFKGSDKATKVSGVMRNMPANSHFHTDMLMSMGSLPEAKGDSWMTSEFFTYLLLRPGTDYKQLEAKLPETVEKYMGPQLQKAMGVTMAEFQKSGNRLMLKLQPLTDIHLFSDFVYDLSPSGDMRYVYIFSAVAAIILVIACINFMNLSTASSSKRAREVGVRKVMGSQKSELVLQFLMESILLTAFAMVLATFLAYINLPLFNRLSGKDLTFEIQTLPVLIPSLIVFGLLVGIFAGSYPAFFLSSFKPITILKGKFTANKNSISLRSGLVVVQFFISVTLMIGTTVVYQQLKFIQNKKLGYNKDQVLILDTWALGQQQNSFRNELLQNPEVAEVSASSYLPAGPSYNNNYMMYADQKSNDLVNGIRYEVDDKYISTMGMELVSGRNFSEQYGTDSSAVIVNETAAAMLGLKDAAVDHTISRNDNEGKKTTYQIIGVVKDFHFKSLHEKITPLVMTLGGNSGNMIVKIKTEHSEMLLSKIKSLWGTYKTEQPFSYSFLDARYDQTYKAEQQTGQILSIFTGLTIFVACLGLFGLATFTAEQRIKEIGVRKVLGASVISVVGLLSKDFIKLVLIAIAFALPVAWWMMTKWLQGFEYKITLAWWMLASASILSVLVALFTVSFQSIKAALTNPVKSLRSE
jgi:putative ABC transport system permease protein